MQYLTKPIIFTGLVCIAGIILQYLLQSSEIIGNYTGDDTGYITIEQGAVLFGMLTALTIVIIHFSCKTKPLFADMNSWSFTLMLVLALFTVIGTLIMPQPAKVSIFTNIYHSFLYTGCLGLLTAGLLAAIWQRCRNLHALKDYAILLSHLGVVIFLSGAAVTSAFAIEGILYLNEGQSAKSFEVVKHNYKTGIFLPLPYEIKLVDFILEKHPVQSYMRIYEIKEDEGYKLINSYPAEKGLVFSFGREKTDKIKVTGIRNNSEDMLIADLKIIVQGKSYQVSLPANGEDALPLNDDLYLVYEQKSEPKLFKSLVEVNNTQHEILVNHPLKVGKYRIYQVDYSEEDETLSGFQITYDPGKTAVKSGLGVLFAGIMLLLFVSTKQREK